MAFSPFPACKKPLDSFAKLRLYLLYAKDRALAHCKYGSDFFRPNNHHALQGKAGTAFTKDGARAEFVFLLFGKLDGRPTTVGENRSFLLCSGPELPMDMQRDFERQLETLARPMLCDYNCLGQTDSVFGCTNLNLETGAFGTHIEIHTNCEGEDPCFVYTGFGDRETSWRSSTAKELPLAGGDWVLVEASLHLHDDPHRVPRKSYDVVAHRIRALNIQPSLNIPPELRATEALEGEMEVVQLTARGPPTNGSSKVLPSKHAQPLPVPKTMNVTSRAHRAVVPTSPRILRSSKTSAFAPSTSAQEAHPDLVFIEYSPPPKRRRTRSSTSARDVCSNLVFVEYSPPPKRRRTRNSAMHNESQRSASAHLQ